MLARRYILACFIALSLAFTISISAAASPRHKPVPDPAYERSIEAARICVSSPVLCEMLKGKEFVDIAQDLVRVNRVLNELRSKQNPEQTKPQEVSPNAN